MKFLCITGILVCLLQAAHAQPSPNKTAPPHVLVPYRQDNLWGFSDTLAKIIVTPVYDSVSVIVYEGYIYKNGKTGIINEYGKVLLAPLYDAMEPVGDEKGYIVSKNHKKGLFTETGKPILQPLFDTIMLIEDNLVVVSAKNRYGLYNRTGKLLLPVQYDTVTSDFFDEKVDMSKWIMTKKGQKYWLVNKQTGKLLPYKFQGSDSEEGAYGEELMAVPAEDYILPSLETVQKRLTDYKVETFGFKTAFGSYRDGDFFLVTKDAKKGLFSRERNAIVVPAEYEQVLFVRQFINAGYFAVKKGGRAGIIDESGKIILPFEYDDVQALSLNENGFEVTLNGKKGVYLLNTHYPVIAPKYDSIVFAATVPVSSTWAFTLYKVWVNGKAGYVGENGVEFFK